VLQKQHVNANRTTDGLEQWKWTNSSKFD